MSTTASIATSAPHSPPNPNPLRAVLWGGLICGVLDITAAFIDSSLRGGNPIRLCQGIAGALLGPATFQGGLATAAFGLALHFSVAFSAATIFVQAARKWPALIQRPIVAAVIYGPIVYGVMRYGVVPLAGVVRSFHLGTAYQYKAGPIIWYGVAIHVGCVALPITLAARKFLRVGGGRT